MIQLIRTAALLLALLAPSASAVTLSISPTVLDIVPERQLSTQTRFVNLDNDTSSFVVEAYRWRVVDGQTVLEPTRDVLVNPAKFTLGPRGTQVIRVGLTRPPTEHGEVTYRVLVRQLPPETAPNTAPSPAQDGANAQITQIVTFSLPVYVAPASARADVTYTTERDGTDLLLHIDNRGNRHVTYRLLEVTDGTHSARLDSQAVLGGMKFTMRLPGFADARELTLTYRDALGKDTRETVKVP